VHHVLFSGFVTNGICRPIRTHIFPQPFIIVAPMPTSLFALRRSRKKLSSRRKSGSLTRNYPSLATVRMTTVNEPHEADGSVTFDSDLVKLQVDPSEHEDILAEATFCTRVCHTCVNSPSARSRLTSHAVSNVLTISNLTVNQGCRELDISISATVRFYWTGRDV